jgi:hypothetical protein
MKKDSGQTRRIQFIAAFTSRAVGLRNGPTVRCASMHFVQHAGPELLLLLKAVE